MKRKNKRTAGKPFRPGHPALQGILLEKWQKAEEKKAKKRRHRLGMY